MEKTKKGNGSIRIACDVRDHLELDELTPFQGELKELSEKAHAQLRAEILATGVGFPFKVWKQKKINWIIGGHQTRLVLLALRAEGYEVPPLPVVYTVCKDEKEARRRVLQDIAQYGEITPQGLFDFMGHAKMDYAQLSTGFRMPDMDMAAFGSSFFPHEKHVEFNAKDGAKELPQGDFQEFDQKCPKCGFEFDDK